MPRGIYKRSNEMLEKLKTLRVGKLHTKETRSKMAESKKGNLNPFYGKKHNTKTKHRMSLLKLRKISNAKGTKRTIESRIKMSLAQKLNNKTIKFSFGDKNPNWQGGKTKLASVIRNSKKYTAWRNEIYIRDDFTCRKCGVRGGKLCVDHITPFSKVLTDYIKEFGFNKNKFVDFSVFWETTNGRTLCWECHKLTPTFGIQKYNITNI